MVDQNETEKPPARPSFLTQRCGAVKPGEPGVTCGLFLDEAGRVHAHGEKEHWGGSNVNWPGLGPDD